MEQNQNQQVAKGAVRNANSRIIFKNPELCCQFIKDNIDIPLLKDIRPEDIEDVSEKYQAYLGIELESDSVKRIRIRSAETGGEAEMYMVSLIEHKSYVDYNVPMQLLKYMVCIWDDYAREMERKHSGITERKGFKYPPVLPVVYYEGRESWTADLNLKDRIFLKEIFEGYLPDFTYRVVRIHDYSNAELLGREDEMSLLMILNKIQSPEDMEEFLDSRKDKIAGIVRKAPEHIIEIIASTIHSLCIKMDMSAERAAQCVEAVKERNMGYLFENMERLDIQLERKYDRMYEKKYREEYAQKWEETRQEMENKRQEIENKQQELENKRREMEEELRRESAEATEKAIRNIVSIYKSLGAEKQLAIKKLVEEYSLSPQDAEERVDLYWNL